MQQATVLELITEAKRRGAAIGMICHDREVRDAGADRLLNSSTPAARRSSRSGGVVSAIGFSAAGGRNIVVATPDPFLVSDGGKNAAQSSDPGGRGRSSPARGKPWRSDRR